MRGDEMAGSKEVHYMMEQTKTNSKQVAEIIGIAHQSMRNKLHRDSFTYAELLTIADGLGFDLKVVIERKEK